MPPRKATRGKRILIGVQARSNSTRLRGKCGMDINHGESTLAGHVLSQSVNASKWLLEANSRLLKDVTCVVSLLIPFGDPIRNQFSERYNVFEGDEEDVLGRYYQAVKHYDVDYVVRLTADCAWMTSVMINKVIRDCMKYGADYCSNVLVRTFMEGLDVEVISARLIRVLHSRVISDTGREHVTSEIPEMLGKNQLNGFVIHTVMSEYDFSDIKTSIDTKEEYDSCNDMYIMRRHKKKAALIWGSISN